MLSPWRFCFCFTALVLVPTFTAVSMMRRRNILIQAVHRGLGKFSVLGSPCVSPRVKTSLYSSMVPGPDGSYRARDVEIPLDRVEFSFARSSGPGGQNVNKLNTKAEIRFHVNSADWLPVAVRARLLQYQSNKVSKDGELIITSQEHRTQAKNKDDCISKLQEMVAEAYVEPKDRQMWEGISDKGKEQRRDEKRKRGSVKSNRGRVSDRGGEDD